jgi:serine-type D-Ala-D-Ala carboxypeptidase/endopeptidase (penicillin-binding protein 4)
MKKILFCFIVTINVVCALAQTITTRLAKAYKIFENDSQLSNAISSLYVIDAKTGKVVFDKNSKIGLAPASTQKIITAATAYEVLGNDFRYTTSFGYYGTINNGALNGSIYVRGSGDPTLGSWRWKSTNEESVIARITTAIKNLGLKNYSSFLIDATNWEGEAIPDGWIWQDIGNYYGAGAGIINWRENQYDLVLKSGKEIGGTVSVVRTKPKLYSYSLNSYVTAAAKGTGDNSYIYFPVNSSTGIVRGTIPVDEEAFVISGAIPSGQDQFIRTLIDSLERSGIYGKANTFVMDRNNLQKFPEDKLSFFHTERSPALDSIVYWFLKKSINLYGEALVKTMADNAEFTIKKKMVATTLNGINVIVNYWNEKGIPPPELNIVDGSGLSPLNRVTTRAQVKILQYAKKQPWFPGYYDAFPEYNGMKMKSGTINGVKAFCGYHKSKAGQEYIFSFIVNNYNGSPSAVVQKMYKVLDELKN